MSPGFTGRLFILAVSAGLAASAGCSAPDTTDDLYVNYSQGVAVGCTAGQIDALAADLFHSVPPAEAAPPFTAGWRRGYADCLTHVE